MKLSFFGDVYLADDCAFSNVDMSKYAPYVYNFEYAYYSEEHPHALHKILLKSTADVTRTFSPLPAAVNINNNHIFDFADEGLKSTMGYLKQTGVPFFGSGAQEDNCNNPCVVEFGGKKIALLGYYHRNRDISNNELKQALFSQEQFLQDMQTCRSLGVDLVIPSVHWGVEDSPVYTKMQQEAAHFMVDNGADLVIGHHPHCIQPWEKYNDKYIFYSLGNFLFENVYTKSRYTDEDHYSCMNCKRWHKWHRESLGVSFDLDTKEVELHLMYQGKNTIKERKLSSEEVFKKYATVKFSTAKTLLRKLISSFSSFVFFKGHIIYWPGIREELKLLYDIHVVNKSWKFSE